MLFKRLVGVELFDGFRNENFIRNYDRYICQPPLSLFIISGLIVVISLASADFLGTISRYLKPILYFSPKYHYELRWMPVHYPSQVDLYTCLSFAVLAFTFVKVTVF